MRKISISVVALIVVAVVIIAGEAYAYLPSDRGFSSDTNIDGSQIRYSMNAAGAYVGSSILIDNGDMKPVKELYIYRDDTYVSNVNENNITATGSQVFTQSYYIDQLTKNLKFRGMDDIKILNAQELKERLSSDTAASPSSKGLVMISGTIPDNIFHNSTILEDWIDAGGYLFWVGNEIGKYASNTDGFYEVNRQIDLIGTNKFAYPNKAAYEDTELRSVFCYENQELKFSPDISLIPAENRLGTGFTDDGTHYSVTFIKKGSGQICICSHEFKSQQIHDLAISICSGLCYKSRIVDSNESEFKRNLSGSFVLPAVHGNLSVYISIGKYHCAYADRYDLF